MQGGGGDTLNVGIAWIGFTPLPPNCLQLFSILGYFYFYYYTRLQHFDLHIEGQETEAAYWRNLFSWSLLSTTTSLVTTQHDTTGYN